MKKLIFIGVVISMSSFGLVYSTLTGNQRILDITVHHASDHKLTLVENMQRWLDIHKEVQSMAKKRPGITISAKYNKLVVINSSMKFAKQFLKMLNHEQVDSLKITEWDGEAWK